MNNPTSSPLDETPSKNLEGLRPANLIHLDLISARADVEIALLNLRDLPEEVPAAEAGPLVEDLQAAKRVLHRAQMAAEQSPLPSDGSEVLELMGGGL